MRIKLIPGVQVSPSIDGDDIPVTLLYMTTYVWLFIVCRKLTVLCHINLTS